MRRRRCGAVECGGGRREPETGTADIHSKIHRIGTGKGTGTGKKVACKASLKPCYADGGQKQCCVLLTFFGQESNIRFLLSSKSKLQNHVTNSFVRMVSGIFSSAISLLAIEIRGSDSSGHSRTSFVAGLKKESESMLWSAQVVSLPSLSDVIGLLLLYFPLQ